MPVSHVSFHIYNGIVLRLYYGWTIFVPFYLIVCCFVGSGLFDAECGSDYKGFVLISLHNTARLEWQEVNGREMLSSCLTLWLWPSIVFAGQVHAS